MPDFPIVAPRLAPWSSSTLPLGDRNMILSFLYEKFSSEESCPLVYAVWVDVMWLFSRFSLEPCNDVLPKR